MGAKSFIEPPERYVLNFRVSHAKDRGGFFEMIIFEILFDLFTAIPFLFFMAFMFNLLLYWRNPKYRRKLKWSCLAFGIISLLFTNYHYNALFK